MALTQYTEIHVEDLLQSTVKVVPWNQALQSQGLTVLVRSYRLVYRNEIPMVFTACSLAEPCYVNTGSIQGNVIREIVAPGTLVLAVPEHIAL